MLQLADVAGPVVVAQRALRVGRQAQAAQAQAGAVELQKTPGQQQHVVAALAQRRNRHRIDRQAVVQVGAKAAVAHMVAQAAVGGGHHAHVHAPGLVGAQALDFAVLQRAQQLGLHAQGQLAHLVQEQRAALGGLKAPGPVGHRAREGAPAVAEQLALGQGFGQRRAVHMHQRLAPARRVAVQEARKQLLAHAGLAQQQHGQVGAGHHLDLLLQAQQGFALAQDFAVVQRGAQVLLVGGFAQVLAGGAAQRVHLLLQPGDAHGRLHMHGAAGQRGAGGGVEGAGLQRVQREHAPGPPVHAQCHAHAVVHRQRLAHQGVEQAVVGVGELAVVVKHGHFATRQDGRQPGVLVHGKTPPQRFAHQPVHHHGPQVAFLQPQQRHGAAAEMRAQATDQALQAQVGGQLGGQIHQPGIVVVGIHYPVMVANTLAGDGEINPSSV